MAGYWTWDDKGTRTLEITTAKLCPVNCRPLCPQAGFRARCRRTPMLALEDFSAALEHTPRDVRIDFSGFCEPFVNPSASSMMRLASEAGHAVALHTTLIGPKDGQVESLTDIAPGI